MLKLQNINGETDVFFSNITYDTIIKKSTHTF